MTKAKPGLSRRLSLGALAAAAFCASASAQTPQSRPAAAAPMQSAPVAPQPAQVWVEADAKSCRADPWDQYQGIGGMLGFFESKGVHVYDSAQISFDQLYDQPVTSCKACTCPAGYTLYILVAQKDAAAVQGLGMRMSGVDPYDANTYIGSRRFAAPAAPAPPPAPKAVRKTAGPRPASKKSKGQSKPRSKAKKKAKRPVQDNS